LYYEPKIQSHESVGQYKAEQNKPIPLVDCISLFTNQEKLSAQDAWYCSKCQEHREAGKKFDVWKAPQLLVIHLKRFQYSRMWRDKLEQLVDYPIEDLDLTPFIVGPVDPDDPPVYDLYAVSNHSGGMGFGHYTAYSKHKLTNTWNKFNDSSVSEVRDPSEVVSSQAYLLFYERKGAHRAVPSPFEYSQEEIDKIYRSAIASSGGGERRTSAGSSHKYGPLTEAGGYSSQYRKSTKLDEIDGVDDDDDGDGENVGPSPANRMNANAGNVAGSNKGKEVTGDGDDVEMTDVAGGRVVGEAGMDESDDEEAEEGLGIRSRRHGVANGAAGLSAAVAAVAGIPGVYRSGAAGMATAAAAAAAGMPGVGFDANPSDYEHKED